MWRFLAAALIVMIVVLVAIIIKAPWWLGVGIGGIVAALVINEDNKFKKERTDATR